MKHTFIIQPHLTEKSMEKAKQKWFTFKVNEIQANKQAIAGVIESQFKVHVVRIKTLVMKGKTTRVGKKRLVAREHDWKKALVKLKDNEKIEVFNIENEPKTK